MTSPHSFHSLVAKKEPISSMFERTHTGMIETKGCLTTDLRGKDYEGGGDDGHHEEFGGPDVGGDVPVAHGGEGDDDEPERLEERKMAASCSLQVLDAAHTERKGDMMVFRCVRRNIKRDSHTERREMQDGIECEKRKIKSNARGYIYFFKFFSFFYGLSLFHEKFFR